MASDLTPAQSASITLPDTRAAHAIPLIPLIPGAVGVFSMPTVRIPPIPALGFAGMSLSMASGACASTSEASANTSLPSQKYEIFLGEEEISDVSLATFYVFDKENAGPPPLFQKPRLAVGGGAGCGCSFGCAYWPQPPQPPKATQPTQHRKKKPPHRAN